MCKLTLFFIENKQICKFTQLYMNWCGLFVGKLCKFYTFFKKKLYTNWVNTLILKYLRAKKKKNKAQKKEA